VTVSTQRSSAYFEKLELVYREYERSLDLDLAVIIVPLSKEEREALLHDEELLARIAVYDAKYKTEMVEALRDLSTSSESDGIKLSALKELGKTYYPKRFKDNIAVDMTMTYKVVRRGAEKEST